LQEKLPTVSEFSQIVEAGGLLSYGSAGPENWLRAVYYVDRLLKGAKAAELPVEQVSKFKLSVNLKTAEGFGPEGPRVHPGPSRQRCPVKPLKGPPEPRKFQWNGVQ